jgi:hypothetical protein
MHRTAVVLALCGCYRAVPPPPPQQLRTVPDVRFAISTGMSVQILRTTSKGLVVERTTPVPAVVSRMFWVGPDPSVWLDMSVGMMGDGFPTESYGGNEEPVGPHQNEMGVVTAAGFKKFEPIAWPPATRPTDFDDLTHEVTEPNAALVATKDALWEKRCRWYGGPDGGWCTYEYARRYPAPVAFSGDVDRNPAPPFPAIRPSNKLEVGHATRLRHPEDDGGDWPDRQELLTCTPSGGDEIEYPPEGQLDHNVEKEVVWLSTEPPIFRTEEGSPDVGVGRSPPLYEKIWESCTPSTRYDATTTGPDGIVVLSGTELSVLWRGREIGHLASGGSTPVFAPDAR